MVTVFQERFKNMKLPMAWQVDLQFKVDYQFPKESDQKHCIRVGIRDDARKDGKNFTCGYIYDLTELNETVLKGVVMAVAVMAEQQGLDVKKVVEMLHNDVDLYFESGRKKAKEIKKKTEAVVGLKVFVA